MNAIKTHGMETNFAISVIEPFPNSYIVLDGHHRLAALYCLHNNEEFEIPAKVYSATLSSAQAEVLSGAKNALHDAATKHGLADTVS